MQVAKPETTDETSSPRARAAAARLQEESLPTVDRDTTPQPTAAPAAARRELRLAVVCYGGVSLCVYMHGTTKELHRLVKASRLLALGAPDDGTSASERLYRELLSEARRPDGVRTDVVVDIVAGTSAGGINGVFL